ncbi:MAG: UDP-3-O-(3-hydroxymyristoyl)glucosamine N-acyltransferase [Magnetococcales bacterium]|nr:UDP-3-O-(3-hydroxymyristoyl)glucosamine N-acyltransferase [Magnetococcales bacterium]
MKLSELSAQLHLPHRGGDPDITGVAPLESAGASDISFVSEKKFLQQAASTAAVIVPEQLAKTLQIPHLISPSPALDLARVGEIFQLEQLLVDGISPQASVHASAQLDESVSVGPNAVIGADCRIGADTVIHSGAVVHQGSIIGERCIIQSNAVVGSEGYGYEFVEGHHRRIAHFGHVEIGNDVDIGANCTIDRGRFGATCIGDGTKIDNLCQIAHNCQIGKHVIIVSQSGVAGSSVVEDYVVIGGQVGVIPHVTIGKGAKISSGGGVICDVPPGATFSGLWGIDHRENTRAVLATRKLPNFMKTVKAFMKKHGG